jgi:threonine-phosphate decarboxylase
MFLIDEAFMDFLPGESIINSLRPNLIVVRSLTKFYGIPGVRMGFAAARAGVIKKLLRFKEPWTINYIAEYFASMICKGSLNEAKEIRRVGREREYLFGVLSAIPCLKVYPSVANFLLVRIVKRRLSSSRLQAMLLRKSILIRDCVNFEGLDPYYFRVAVKSRKENLILIKALRECMGPK